MNEDPVATDIELFSLTSRIGRLRYLAYGMAYGLLGMVPVFLCFLLMLASPAIGTFALLALDVVLIVFGVGLAVRRLHDLDKTGWLALLMIVPLVNFFFFLYLLFAAGTIGENSYGKQPPPNSTWVIVGAWSFILVPLLGGVLAAIAIPAYQDFVARSQTAEALQLAGGTEEGVKQYFATNKAWPDSLAQAYPAADLSVDAGKFVDSVTGSATADGGYVIVATMKTEGIMWDIRGKSMELWTSDGGASWHCGPGGADPVDPRYLIGSCRDAGAP